MENLDVVSAVDFYLEKAFYLFGFIMLGMAWLTFRAGSTYQHFKNADKLVSEGRGSVSSGKEPEMIRRLKFQTLIWYIAKEGANKRGNSSRLTQSFHFFMFEPIFSPVNALNQPI